MSYLSACFLGFILVLLVLYYITPRTFRWLVLLAASLIFYCWDGTLRVLVYLIGTALSTWLAARIIDMISTRTSEYIRSNPALTSEDKKKAKNGSKKRKKLIFIFALLVNLLILGVVKYSNLVIGGIVWTGNALTGTEAAAPVMEFLIPLGISYYTLQSLGYLTDVYWGKYKAEKNFAKYLLFISYFPQIVQGPIGRYDHLMDQLADSGPFRYENLKNGAILALWGYMKKLVIADRLAPFVVTVFEAPQKYDGSIIVTAVLIYAIQLYADFSGGIDIVSGVSEMFGVRLTPNFMRPYFARSLGDFWRRWHISLGAWMRDYVFYPFAKSKAVSGLCRKLRKNHKKFAGMLPAMLGNLCVFFLVGLWHGAEPKYIVWGLYNGVILAADVLCKPLYDAFYKKFPVLRENLLWHLFQIARTFFIVCVGYYFDCCKNVRGALGMMARSLTDFHLSALRADLFTLGVRGKAFLAAAAAAAMLFAVSLLQERGVQIRQRLNGQRTAVQWALLYGLIFFVIAFAATGTATEGFMYAIF